MLDWLAREGGIVLSWWALVTVAGVAALPLCFRLLGSLPDRGYTLARSAGLLLTGFVFWLLASFGFLRNTTGSMALAWAVVLIAGLVIYLRQPIDLRAWWRENRRVVLVGEVLFFVLLLGWSYYRANQNSLLFTEKPMELAFLSSVIRSETFPPADPWMAGYAISYYYFGYVIAGMLSKLSGIASTVGFNMTNALLFALTGLGAFGVVYNLVRSRANGIADARPSRGAALLAGLLGMVFVVLLGNFQLPLIEIPYQSGTASEAYLQMYDSEQRQSPVGGAGTVDLNRWENWWWFRSARVLNDRNLDGSRVEVIDEFPQFSFLLADNHPHVLALPFAVLALGAALNLLLTQPVTRPPVGETVFYGLIIGGLIFLNTWDGPIYAAALLGADGLRRVMRRGRLLASDWIDLFVFAVMLVAVAVVAYLPFLVAFRSQAGGIVPNLQYPTLFSQFFVMFAPLLLILVPFLIIEVWRAGDRANWRFGIQTGLLIVLALVVVMLLLGLIAWLIPELQATVLGFVQANGGWGSVIPALLAKRVTHGITTLVLNVGLILVLARLFARARQPKFEEATALEEPAYPAATGYALLLVGIGILLTLAPEFIYLRDNFGTRMNTVFKFYYQAWLVWSVAAAYAAYTMLADARLALPSKTVRATLGGVVALVLALGLLFPAMGIHHRTVVETGRVFADPPVTLDGGQAFTSAANYEAIMCLDRLVDGNDVVVAQAVGNSYNGEYGMVGTLTGIPVLLNWPGHQGQWRGATYGEIAGSRYADIERLYTSPTWRDVEQVVAQYGIDYIVFSSTERSVFGSESEIKFLDNLEVVCESGSSRIYRAPVPTGTEIGFNR